MSTKTVGIILGVGVLVVLALSLMTRTVTPLGISLQEPDFSTATSTAVSCAFGATSSVVAAQTGRTSYIAINISTSTAYLCRTSGVCSATSGIPLFGTSTAQVPFIQTDGYKGPYVCSAATANATITSIFSQ